MELKLDNVQRPVRRLQESLKGLRHDTPIEEVRNLRIHARRLDAIVAALMMDHKKLTRHLLKTIKPVRKAAGNVRDMDVLAGNARSLAKHRHDDSVIRLLEHLRGIRAENARELLDTIADRRKDARRSLKHFSKQIEKQFSRTPPHATSESKRNEPHDDAALNLISELKCWPAFSAKNLHPFRIKVKELRYILQLARNADPRFVSALGKVKDRIGDWHDWHELTKIAEKVLNPREDRAILWKIGKIGEKKLHQAIAAADEMRTLYLGNYTQARRRKSSSDPSHLE